MKKNCIKCKQDFLLSSFNKRAKGLQPWCRACQSNIAKQHYLKNKIIRRSQIKLWKQKYRLELKNIIDSRKAIPCPDCGRSFPPCAMDFDHVRGTKIEEISIMLAKQTAKKRLLEEIEKCEAVCACCHRIRTFNRNKEISSNGKILDSESNDYGSTP